MTYLREHFYNKELTRTAITVSPDGERGAYGWCSIHEIRNADEEKYWNINLCTKYLDRPWQSWPLHMKWTTSTIANYSIEIQRNNVTLTHFLRYVRKQCEKKRISMEIDREEFEKSYRAESYSYMVVKEMPFRQVLYYREPVPENEKLPNLGMLTRYYYSDRL